MSQLLLHFENVSINLDDFDTDVSVLATFSSVGMNAKFYSHPDAAKSFARLLPFDISFAGSLKEGWLKVSLRLYKKQCSLDITSLCNQQPYCHTKSHHFVTQFIIA